MHELDSRTLGPLNCFVQKVTEAGDFYFEIRQSSAGFCPVDEKSVTRVKVKANKADRAQMRTAGTQHTVPVSYKDGVFQAQEMPKDIVQGDAVLFHAAMRDAPDFAVTGQMGRTPFSSTELRDQAVFTHAFGLPGRYRWADANGADVGGVIVVENEPACGKAGAQRALERLSEGVLVHIVGNKVKPKELRITTGQTVFFAVEDCDGITITDVSLLGDARREKSAPC